MEVCPQATLPYYCNTVLQWPCTEYCNRHCCGHERTLQNITVAHIFWAGTGIFWHRQLFSLLGFAINRWIQHASLQCCTMFYLPIPGRCYALLSVVPVLLPLMTVLLSRSLRFIPAIPAFPYWVIAPSHHFPPLSRIVFWHFASSLLTALHSRPPHHLRIRLSLPALPRPPSPSWVTTPVHRLPQN
jgi:hypothetical protein